MVRTITICENNKGYMLCCLYSNKRRHTCYVHRLVAEAFLPTNRDIISLEVNHKDKNPKNNHVDNLEWTTCFDNGYHRVDPVRYRLIENLKTKINKLSNEELAKLISSIE